MLSYNGVSLAYTNSLSIVQGPEKDPSGTDTIFFTTRIRAKAVIAGSISPATGGETPPATAARITHLLCSPRRALLFAPDGSNYLVNLPDGLDDANGPEPDLDAFTIQEIAPGSYVVTFAVTVRQTLCQGSLSRPYLSLRWSEVTEIDANWLQVKRRSGLLICSSRGSAPDDLRHLITPGIHGGFKREAADYQLEESGLRLRFNFIDRQLADAVPYPLLDFDGQMSEVVTGNGLTRKADFRLRATSAPGIPKRAMLNTVLMMAMSRVYATNPLTSSSGAVLMNGSIGERLSTKENTIEVHLNWDIMPVKGREKPSGDFLGGVIGGGIGAGIGGFLGGTFGAFIGGAFGIGVGMGGGARLDNVPQASVSIFAAWMGQPFPFTDPTRGIAPPTRGLAPWVTLAAAALNDPCGQEAVLTAGGGESTLVGTTAGGTTVTASVVPEVTAPDEQSLYSGEAGGGVWQQYELELHYHDDTGRRVMSGTAPGGLNEVVRVANRTLILDAEFHLVRMGGPPTNPDFEELRDKNWVYLKGTTSPGTTRTAADGYTPIFTISGVWRFAALDPVKGLASVHYPIPPFIERALVGQAVQGSGTGNGGGAGGGGAPAGTGGVTPGPMQGGPGGGGLGTGGGTGTTGGESSGSTWMSNAFWSIQWDLDHAPFPRVGVLGEVSAWAGAGSATIGP